MAVVLPDYNCRFTIALIKTNINSIRSGKTIRSANVSQHIIHEISNLIHNFIRILLVRKFKIVNIPIVQEKLRRRIISRSFYYDYRTIA